VLPFETPSEHVDAEPGPSVSLSSGVGALVEYPYSG
jgi:hypothetical protein